jgi:hypothetical protein
MRFVYSVENRYFNPPTPQSWGDIEGSWGTPPDPHQRGKAPYGIPFFVLNCAGGNHNTADSVENVILSVAKNLSLREKKSLYFSWNPLYRALCSPRQLGITNSYFNFFHPHSLPVGEGVLDFPLPVWERVRVRGNPYLCPSWVLLTWATTAGRPDGPNPRQRGIAPYGIPFFVLNSAVGNHSMADSVENVILSVAKNLSLREKRASVFYGIPLCGGSSEPD